MFILKKPVTFNRLDFNTVEHAYVSAKTEDPDWNKIKFSVNLITRKFQNNTDLAKLLIDTEEQELIEGNTWNDTYWGQCPLGNGENKLGKILMQVRKELSTST